MLLELFIHLLIAFHTSHSASSVQDGGVAVKRTIGKQNRILFASVLLIVFDANAHTKRITVVVDPASGSVDRDLKRSSKLAAAHDCPSCPWLCDRGRDSGCYCDYGCDCGSDCDWVVGDPSPYLDCGCDCVEMRHDDRGCPMANANASGWIVVRCDFAPCCGCDCAIARAVIATAIVSVNGRAC